MYNSTYVCQIIYSFTYKHINSPFSLTQNENIKVSMKALVLLLLVAASSPMEAQLVDLVAMANDRLLPYRQSSMRTITTVYFVLKKKQNEIRRSIYVDLNE